MGGGVAPFKVNGSANHVGDGTDGEERAQVRFVGKFRSEPLRDVAAKGQGLKVCEVEINQLLFFRETEKEKVNPEIIPKPLGLPRSGGKPTAVIFEKSGRPSFRMELKIRDLKKYLFEFNLKVERATIDPIDPIEFDVADCPDDPLKGDLPEAALDTAFTITCPAGGEKVTTKDLPPPDKPRRGVPCWRLIDDFSIRTP